METPYWRRLDEALGGALSLLCKPQPSLNTLSTQAQRPAEQQLGRDGSRGGLSESEEDADASFADEGPADPSDEVLCGDPDGDTLLDFCLFHDGVQLNAKTTATTTVFSLKCLALPANAVNTLMASYNVAFISGGITKKEPTTLTDFVTAVIAPFIGFTPRVVKAPDGPGMRFRPVIAVAFPCGHWCFEFEWNAAVTQFLGANLQLHDCDVACSVFTVRVCICIAAYAVQIVSKDTLHVWDSFRQRRRKIVPILTLAFADTPARRAWNLTCGHCGRSGCDKCGIRGTRVVDEDGNGFGPTRFLGCASDAPTLSFNLEGEWKEGTIRYGDKRFVPERDAGILITNAHHSMRAQLAEDITEKIAALHPLPAAAANGGTLDSDPSSPEQRRLTQGECVSCQSHALHAVCAILNARRPQGHHSVR
jgi:hypothetical protein